MFALSKRWLKRRSIALNLPLSNGYLSRLIVEIVQARFNWLNLRPQLSKNNNKDNHSKSILQSWPGRAVFFIVSAKTIYLYICGYCKKQQKRILDVCCTPFSWIIRYLWLAKALIMREEEEQLFCDLFQILEKEFGSKFLLVNDIWRAPATALFKEFNHFFAFTRTCFGHSSLEMQKLLLKIIQINHSLVFVFEQTSPKFQLTRR